MFDPYIKIIYMSSHKTFKIMTLQYQSCPNACPYVNTKSMMEQFVGFYVFTEINVIEMLLISLSYPISQTTVPYEARHEKSGFLPMRKQRPSGAVTAQLICAFVFATRIVQFLLYLNPKFQASSCLL